MDANTRAWNSWLASARGRLISGEHLLVPTWLGDPRNVGFVFERYAEDVGQRADLVYPLGDESRLHIHVFDGYCVIHRDRFDPSRGFVPMIAHVIRETKIGPIVVAGAFVAFVARLVADAR